MSAEPVPVADDDGLVVGRTLPMAINLFERECLHIVKSIPLDDPLADFDFRDFAVKAVLLCREFTDYRAQIAAERLDRR